MSRVQTDGDAASAAVPSRFTSHASRFTALVRPGDWVVIFLAALAVAWLFAALWQGGPAKRAVIRAGGQIFAEVPLDRDRSFRVPGPLGDSIITIRAGRARVEADPGPRQYCVKQGWLERPGDIAVCLPNQVSLELGGATRTYDSLNY